MAKFKAGIPDGFTLNVPPVDDLGDYFDEPSPRPPPRQTVPLTRTAAVQEEPVRVLEVPVAVQNAQATIARVTPAAPPVQSQQSVIAAEPSPTTSVENDDNIKGDRVGKSKGSRREINMSPETHKMSDELLDLIRNGSGQRDTKASELFHALVTLAHEAMSEINVHALPKRGRWGTPTARAYPLELKNAILNAVIKKSTSGN